MIATQEPQAQAPGAVVTFAELAALEAELSALAARFAAASAGCPKDHRLRHTAEVLADAAAFRTAKVVRRSYGAVLSDGPPGYAEKVCQEDKEARHRRAVAKIAEPLLKGLPQTGTHHFPPAEFRALVQFLFDGEPGKAAHAFKRDRFKILKLEFVCQRVKGETTTLSKFAREHRIPQRTVHDRATRAHLKGKRIGNRLLYSSEELRALLLPGTG